MDFICSNQVLSALGICLAVSIYLIICSLFLVVYLRIFVVNLEVLEALLHAPLVIISLLVLIIMRPNIRLLLFVELGRRSCLLLLQIGGLFAIRLLLFLLPAGARCLVHIYGKFARIFLRNATRLAHG